VIKEEKMGQSQETNNDTNIKEKKKKETSAEKKAMISEDVALGDIASDKIFEADPELAKELEENRKIQAKALEYKEKKLQRAKKRKKRIIIALIVIAVLGVAGFLGYKYYQQKKAEENSEAIVSVTDSQELVYASVTSIAGNNITVEIVQESTGNNQANIEMSQGSMGEEVIDMTSGAENSSDLSSMGGSNEDASAREMQGAPAGVAGDSQMQMGSMNIGSSESSSSYISTGETAEYQIPVGTVVITKLGTSATFSSISTGNVIALALEKGTDIIDKVWIIE